MFVVNLKNLTQNKSDKLFLDTNYKAPRDFLIPGANKFTIGNHGGNIKLKTLNILSNILDSDIICIGDSKTFGVASGNSDSIFSELLKSIGSTVNYGGDADRTVEILQSLPYVLNRKFKYAILACVGRNDLYTGIPTQTWQSNYLSIVNLLQSNNIKVIHVIGIGEPFIDQTTLYSYILANFTDVVDLRNTWDNTKMLFSDSIHPNEYGNRHIANSIKESNLVEVTDYTYSQLADYIKLFEN